jgi:sugar-specific transcriptional regulator TrmB
MSLAKDIQTLGFNEKETAVYLACLELGESNIQDIAKKSKVSRTTVYDIVESLKQKGLISITKRNKKIFYFAEDPRALKMQLEEKQGVLSRILPELLSVTNTLEKKPKIRYFEGEGGIKEVYKDTLRFHDQELLGWGSEKALENFDADFLNDYYVPARIKNKIFVRAIAPDNAVWQKYKVLDEKSLRKLKLIPKDKFPFEVEINLYGKKNIAIFSFQEKIALIIESEKIFITLKSIFELNWTITS